MRPIELKAENFLSWAKVDYIFEDRVIALSGDNKTEGDQGGNGSGKSSLQQMVFYAYTGNNIRNVLDKKLIRRGEDCAKVYLKTYCPQRNQTLEIERIIPLKGSSKLSIKVNNEEVSFANITDGNRFILDWLSISAEDLKSYYIICKECYKSFFKASNTEKLNLISRFINFSYLDKVKSIIDTKVCSLNAKKRAEEQKRDIATGKREVYLDQLKKEEDRDLAAEREKKIEVYKKNIRFIEQEVIDIDSNIEKRKKNYEVLLKSVAEKEERLNLLEKERGGLEDPSTYEQVVLELQKELKKLNGDLETFKAKQNGIETERSTVKSQLQRVKVNLAGKITCPKCKHEFLTLKTTSLEDELKKQDRLYKEEKSLAEKYCEVSSTIEQYASVIDEYKKAKNESEEEEENARNKVRSIENKISQLTSELNSLRIQMDSILERNKAANKSLEDKAIALEELEKKIKNVDSEIKVSDLGFLKDKVAEFSKEIESNEKIISDLEDSIYKENLWIERFKAFKMYLAIEQIKNIQSQANLLLQKERSDLRLIIESFKKDSKGNVKEEITPYVFREQAESFWYYSGGERARVEIALILAIQTMINTTNKYGGLDFLYLDEITEGLSEEGLYNVIEALDFVQYPVLITTQVSNQNVKCAALKIEKVNGVSKII